MIIGVLTRNPGGWASRELVRAIGSLGHKPFCFRFRDIVSFVDADRFKAFVGGVDVTRDLSAIIARPFGRVSLDQAIYRIDLLYALQEQGVPVFNKPSAIEKCVDKFRSLYTFRQHGLPAPRTIVAERSSLALRGLELLGSRFVVLKPMFGSRGHGSARFVLGDRDVMWEVTRSLQFTGHTIYLQEYIEHGGMDLRVFVLGYEVLAAMIRKAPSGSWKTNIARGGSPIPLKRLDPEVEDLAIKAARVLECEIAGVDIVRTKESMYVLEVNSQPGWRGLQSAHPDIDIAMEISKYVVSKAKR
ncbi:MAG: RimK family alpha-L-glutamate ligase [Thermofilum sp.]|nr:RimK family alpha-L-glutamate ligase [Thermofilum sp.]